ncbi:7-carboxy-7-deazaguanine synthase QueE [Candidatus Cyanaurora vandensis]|nr:7-carboxy-7-deazaguanine synthase QueE [Candidatus Cyanaurora vandensis]
MEAWLVEVFSAIQGEGPLVGERQLFIRFGGCDLRCSWCDSPQTHSVTKTARVEQHSGARDFIIIQNPVSVEQLGRWVSLLQKDYPHAHLSLTGGEPLLHHRFLQAFLPQCPIPAYLETGGHHPKELAAVLPALAWVSMDLKLPSACGEQPLWTEHEESLRLCVDQGVQVYTKWVITGDTDPADLNRAAQLVAGVDPDILVVLQPVTPQNGAIAPTPAQVLAWQSGLSRRLNRVRVIPQTHKLLDQL